MKSSVRIWDLPTRLFHWLLALVVLAAFVTAKVGGNAMQWHLTLGLAALWLLGFRLTWGVIGGRWSRFSSFVPRPGLLRRELRDLSRGGIPRGPGHGALGGLATLLLLALLIAQVATGLVADDEIATAGPLNRFVSTDAAQAATAWHHGWGQWLLVAMVALHVLAIVWFRLARKTDLLTPMLSGDKQAAPGTAPSVDSAVTRIVAAGLALLCAMAVVALARWVA